MCCQDEKLDGIVVEEECPDGVCKGTGIIGKSGSVDIHCDKCNGTGTITRQAEWGDIDIKEMLYRLIDLYEGDWNAKSGGRLKVKE